MRLGLIADTHGRLPSSVLDYFSGVELILHAGDIGSLGVLDELAKAAPVVAVVGNMDRPPLTASHPVHRFVEAEGITILLVHRPPSLREVESMACQEAVQAVHVVVHGHTHQRRLEDFVRQPWGRRWPRRFTLGSSADPWWQVGTGGVPGSDGLSLHQQPAWAGKRRRP